MLRFVSKCCLLVFKIFLQKKRKNGLTLGRVKIKWSLHGISERPKVRGFERSFLLEVSGVRLKVCYNLMPNKKIIISRDFGLKEPLSSSKSQIV